MPVQTRDEIKRVLGQITFAPSCVDMGWEWEVSMYEHRIGGWLVRTTFQRPDTTTGEMGKGFGRCWFVKKGESVSGLVKTVWVACQQIVEHELMEAFMFQSVRVFDPHADVADLIDLNRRRRPWLAANPQPKSCRNYDPWNCSTDADGNSVAPLVCRVCGGSKAEHRVWRFDV